jgi:hypothetical protein
MKIFDKFLLVVIALSLLMLIFTTSKSYSAAYRDELPVPFSQIVWDHTDVSGWAVTAKLEKVYIEGSLLWVPNNKACCWPMYDHAVNANVWVFHLADDGRWHANTWDFMRVNQISKHAGDVGAPDGWRPVDGEEVYFLVSGIARPGYGQTVQERSNIIRYFWRGAVGLPPNPCEGAEPPQIHSFTGAPEVVTRGVSGFIDEERKYNLHLDWDVVADTLGLVADDGRTAETTVHDAVVNGVDLFIDQPTTFTLTARNDCTPEAEWPSASVFVDMKGPNMSGVNLLLLPDYGSAQTF